MLCLIIKSQQDNGQLYMRKIHTATVKILIAPSTASPTLVLPATNCTLLSGFFVCPVKNLENVLPSQRFK